MIDKYIYVFNLILKIRYSEELLAEKKKGGYKIYTFIKKKALLNSNFKIFFASSLKLIWKYIFIKLIGFFILRQLN